MIELVIGGRRLVSEGFREGRVGFRGREGYVGDIRSRRGGRDWIY